MEVLLILSQNMEKTMVLLKINVSHILPKLNHARKNLIPVHQDNIGLITTMLEVGMVQAQRNQ